MGTSADLAVRHRGQTYYQHTSYDGMASSVLPQIIATLVAAGPEALATHLDKVGKQPAEDEGRLDRRGMGGAYLAACQTRGKEPVVLDAAMYYEYGNPDFAHGGVIPLFAPQPEWVDGFCHGIEEAGYILDIDKGALVVPNWTVENKAGSYDAGTMDTLWKIDFSQVLAIDPTSLQEALRRPDYDADAAPDARKATIDGAIQEAVRRAAGQASRPYSPYFPSPSDGKALPSVHLLRGLARHRFQQQVTADFLRSLASDMPVFAEPMAITVKAASDGEVDVIVDLRAANDPVAQGVTERVLEAVARSSGMVYEMKGDGTSRTSGAGFMSSRVSAGCLNCDDPAWDAGLVPDDSAPLGLPEGTRKLLDTMLQGRDGSALEWQLGRAVVGFDDASWQRIEESGLLGGAPQDIVAKFVPMAVEACGYFESGLPGSTTWRFARLSESHKKAFLEAMVPIDRHLFTQLLRIHPAEGGSRKRRSPR